MKNQFKSFSTYLKQEYFWHIMLATGLFLGTLLLSVWQKPFHDQAQWLDPLFGLMTMVFALFLWWTSVKREHSQIDEQSKAMFAKRLTLKFIFSGKVVLECKEAMLTDAGDIRAWSQQVGSQMVGGRNLDFYPFIKIEEPLLQADPKTDRQFWHYTAVFTLKSLPKPTEKPTEYQTVVDSKLATGQCLYWTPVYDHGGRFQLVELWSEALSII